MNRRVSKLDGPKGGGYLKRSPDPKWSRTESYDLGSWQAAYNYALQVWAAKRPYTWSYRYVVSKRDGSWRVYYELMAPLKRPRGICSGCGEDVALYKDGTVYKHNYTTGRVCFGSNKPGQGLS